MNFLINPVRKFVRGCGYDVVHFNPLRPLLEAYRIDLVLDVGANEGQTYDMFRESGYQGKIVSFEPNAEALAVLNRKQGFNWEKHQLALSSQAGEAEFFATRYTGESGLHPHLNQPVLNRFKVPTQRLDQVWKWDPKSAFLKVDTEGHDLEVVKGATGVMDRISLIMAEVALTPRYEGEPVLAEMVKTFKDFGFRACKLHQLYGDWQRGVDLNMDLIFCRDEIRPAGGQNDHRAG